MIEQTVSSSYSPFVSFVDLDWEFVQFFLAFSNKFFCKRFFVLASIKTAEMGSKSTKTRVVILVLFTLALYCHGQLAFKFPNQIHRQSLLVKGTVTDDLHKQGTSLFMIFFDHHSPLSCP
jgi:hypothetical protein